MEPRFCGSLVSVLWNLCRPLPALGLILSAGLAVMISLAYASPTDPTWVAGIYDAADYDDVIDLLTDTTAVGEPGSTIVVRSLSAVVARVACSSVAVSGIGVILTFCLRSPPNLLKRQVERNWVGWVSQRPVPGSPNWGACVFAVSSVDQYLGLSARVFVSSKEFGFLRGSPRNQS